MPGLVFNPATMDDLDAIAAMYLESWRAAYASILSPSALKRRGLPAFQGEWKIMLQSASCDSIVARSGNAIWGACAIGDCGDPDLTQAVDAKEVYSIYVDPQHQRTRIGWRLLDAHLCRAKYSRLYAWVVVGNRSAESFFKAMGFTKEPKTEKDFPILGRVLRVVRFKLRVGKLRRYAASSK